MEELSLLDKFGVLFESIFQHPLFIIIFFLPIILFFLQKKHGKKVYIIVYFISIFLILIIGGDELFKLFDNFMDGLFMVLYFPNFITLFIVALLSAMFGFISLFSKGMHKIYKVINYTFFGIVQSLFILVILTIRSNEINIYKDNALYSNSDVLSLMQIMIGAFGIQIVALVIINLINRVTSILDSKDSELSKSINKQISTLSNSKIKLTTLNSNKIGYINVADKKKSSIPILKPFKFDMDKLVNLNVIFKPKKYSESKIESDSVSYLNEITKPYKETNLQSDNVSYLNEITKPYKEANIQSDSVSYLNEITKPYKEANLQSDNVSYLNEVTKPYKEANIQSDNVSYLNEVVNNREYRFLKLDSSKIISLNIPTQINKVIEDTIDKEKIKEYKIIDLDSSKIINLEVDEKPYKCLTLGNKDFSYLNEIIFKKSYKIIKLLPNKIITLKTKDREFKNIILNFNEVSYLNEIKKKYHIVDLSKIDSISLNTEKKKVSFVNLKDKAISYLHEVIKKPKLKLASINTEKEVKFKENNKPDLLAPMVREERFITSEEKPKDTFKNDAEVLSILNLNIVDIQSTLDVISKHHLMKDVKLEGYDENDAVDNLKIGDFDLLLDILKKYKLYKNK